MKIRTNLFLLAAIFVILISMLGLVTFRTFYQINKGIRKNNNASMLIKDIFELNIVTNEYVMHHEERMVQQWRLKYNSLGKQLKLIKKDEGHSEHLHIIKTIITDYKAIGSLFSQLHENFVNKKILIKKNRPQSEINTILTLEKRLIAHSFMKSQDITTAAFRFSTLIEQTVIRVQSQANSLILISIIGFAIFSFCISFLTIRTIIKPINELTKGTEIIGRGDLEHKIDLRAKNEMGQLANSFNKMTEDLREITERLKATNVELESFSYSVSHDLRAPLRALDGFSKIMLEDYTGKLDAAGKDYLNRIRNASQRMAQLIDDLLSLSRITRREIKPERVDLTELAKSITKDLEKTEPTREAEFVVQEGIIADGDAHLLRIMLENLLNNAWKFTSKTASAKIEFGTANINSQHAYFVRDNGIGLDMAYAEKLYGAFQRLHSEEEFPGTGIGLATVKRIINQHGGKIWVESKVGKGATFYFKLSS